MMPGDRTHKHDLHSKGELIYQVALTLVPGIGDVKGKKLVSHCGGVEAVFREKKKHLLKIGRVGQELVNELGNKKYLRLAEREIRFMERYHVTPLFYYDAGYPARLKHCHDSPLMLYYKGAARLNPERVIGVVGTRKPSAYGKEACARLVEGLSGLDILVVSGLAYGIDACAHKTSLLYGNPTVGVLAHGLDTIYPHLNRNLAEKMLVMGGLITEFPSGTRIIRDYFPRRNRVIAGMSDAVLVVESADKGGALITAQLANSYNREVFALPGRSIDPRSAGCNFLIKTQQAALVESSHDIMDMMGWVSEAPSPRVQKRLFINLTEEEEKIMTAIRKQPEIAVEDLYLGTGISFSKIASLLLKLEFDGLILALPGKMYKCL